jgi:hypothetical protein
LVYDYATSNVPNGLDAILKADDPEPLLMRAEVDGKMLGIVRAEQSADVIAKWIGFHILEAPERRISTNMVRTIAERIAGQTDFAKLGRSFMGFFQIRRSLAMRIWRFLDKPTLGARLTNVDNVLEMASFMTFVKICDEDMAGETFWSVDRHALARRLEQQLTVSEMHIFLSSIRVSNNTVAEEACRFLRLQRIARILNNTHDRSSAFRFVQLVYELDAGVALDLCDRLKDRALASAFRCFADHKSGI